MRRSSQTMEFCSALKRDKVPSHETTRRDLECVLPGERGRCEKAVDRILIRVPATGPSRKRQSCGDNKRIGGRQGLDGGLEVERDEWAEHRGFLGQ